ncbi:hypothetical protein ROZALSC1DRAFT_28133 [Rozella allomycis CSF55]|uniref:ERF1 1/Pelota-like domain-containing protein n=1 Tax=Rozella allomycis (strain CSF55) TaxID=988480 RepID=A0A075AZC6_ROZAC|nr:eRF1 1/Pelota-like domain-containing protein [Rozella allomycis CSF55]RKP20368.1 hypothetical protein ROZALSC1DRAFT_28133 [Rozella allomycis CSF55]|eukprot:EPZ35645.1 eRF1 1/Pelota-like domain-containing protein [Rozella allomycis CSF55]
MKVLHKFLQKDASGTIKLLPEDLEDMWHIYNLLCIGDKLTCSTIRKVQTESSTGSVDSNKMRLYLTIEIYAIEGDMSMGVIRVNGRVCVENKHVKLGSYHTIDLCINNEFKLFKDEWDIISLERIDQICHVKSKAEIGAVILQDGNYSVLRKLGLANVCLVTDNMIVVMQRIEVNIPKKRLGSTTQREKAQNKFMEQIYNAIIKHIPLADMKAIIIASPGFLKDQLFSYIMKEAQSQNSKIIFDAKNKFLLVHCSTGHKSALSEVLQDPSIQHRLSDTKYAKEIKEFNKFHEMLKHDPDRVTYGFDSVNIAAENHAIKTLFVTDGLFR